MIHSNPYYLDYSEQKQFVRSLTERRKILLNLIEEECNEEKRKIYKHMLCEIQVKIKFESRICSFLKKEWNENDSLAKEPIIVENNEVEEQQDKWLGYLCILFFPLLIITLPYWVWKGYQKER